MGDDFHGWGGFDKTSVDGKLQWFSFEPKPFCDDDVDIKILYCGICGTDLHQLSSGWGDNAAAYPIVAGHEIVGTVLRVGKDVKDLKVGDMVGVGPQCDSCGKCSSCNSGEEQYCTKGIVWTYGSVYDRQEASRGHKTYGGYANSWRGPSHFVVKIPSKLDPSVAGPLLCAGLTVWSPFKQYRVGEEGGAKTVGVVGIGGVGHVAVMFAKALGAEVTALTHSPNKSEDARKLGADHVLVLGDKPAEAVKGYERSLDLILVASDAKELPLTELFSLVSTHGIVVFVSVPEVPYLPLRIGAVLYNNLHVCGSVIGSTQSLKDMLAFAAEHHIEPWVEKMPMNQANAALLKMKKGVRYRLVLVNEENGAIM